MGLGSGQHANDDSVMRAYVQFIASQIKLRSGACVNSTKGFPMKGCYVPVKLAVTGVTLRSILIQMEVLGYVRDFEFMMSRHWAPSRALFALQQRIDEVTLEVIRTEGLNQDVIHSTHHALSRMSPELLDQVKVTVIRNNNEPL